MASVSSIYRYPVKGLSAQPLARVDAEAGRPIAYDRVFALARPTAPLDRRDPKWFKKGLFAMLMLDEGLAQVATSLDVDTMWLTAWRAGRQVAAGCLKEPTDCEALERFFWTLLPSFKDPPVLIRSRGAAPKRCSLNGRRRHRNGASTIRICRKADATLLRV